MLFLSFLGKFLHLTNLILMGAADLEDEVPRHNKEIALLASNGCAITLEKTLGFDKNVGVPKIASFAVCYKWHVPWL